MSFAERAIARYELRDRSTLEVGSYDVNGSVRGLFSGDYLGVDVREGPGVDVEASAEHLPFEDRSYHTVISTEMLEHCERPWLAVAEMARVGEACLILTARGYDQRGCFPVHHDPSDLWRFSEASLRLLVEDAGLEVIECQADPEAPGVLLVAGR